MDHRPRRDRSSSVHPMLSKRDHTLPIVWLLGTLGSLLAYTGSSYLFKKSQDYLETCKSLNLNTKACLTRTDLNPPWFKAFNLIVLYFTLLAGRHVLLGFYRVTFHPLSQFPGPKLAAWTSLYEVYYGFFKDGEWIFKLQKDIHPKYGFIIRTRPNYLHISDPDTFFEIHKVNSPYLKDMNFYDYFGAPQSLLGLNDPKAHRTRRSLLSKIFSRDVIKKRAPFVQERCETFCARISEKIRDTGTGTVLLNTAQAGYCFQFDIISELVFTGNHDFISLPSLSDPKFDSVENTLEGMPLLRYAPSVLVFLEHIPDFIMDRLVSGSTGQKGMRREIMGDVHAARRMLESGELAKLEKMPSVITELMAKLEDDNAIASESQIMFGAGLHTTNFTFNGGLYFLSENKDVQTRLFEELKTIWPKKNQAPEYSRIEALPYLTAFVKEVLRLAFPQPGPNPRVAPKGAKLLGHDIPAGTIVETDCYHIHMNPSIFPSPNKFLPDRWLSESARRNNLEKYLTLFSSGSRMCIGVHIAYMSLYALFASIVRNFEVDMTDKMRAEGYVWTEKWSGAKRGEPFKFNLKEREQ